MLHYALLREFIFPVICLTSLNYLMCNWNINPKYMVAQFIYKSEKKGERNCLLDPKKYPLAMSVTGPCSHYGLYIKVGIQEQITNEKNLFGKREAHFLFT